MLQSFCCLWPDFRHCYASVAFCVLLFSDKYLKKWYHLAVTRFVIQPRPGGSGAFRLVIMRLIREQPRDEGLIALRDRRRSPTSERKSSLRYGGHGDCIMNARSAILAHEISSMPDRVIERLRRRRS